MFPHEEFQKNTNTERYTVEGKFYSKKNEVYKVKCFEENMNYSKILVVKKYLQSLTNMENEIYFLTELYQRGVAVPKIYRVENNWVILEYIEGTTLLELLEAAENNSSHLQHYQCQVKNYLTNQLLNWLEGFYFYTREVTGKNFILKDIHLRNFIMKDHLVGVDFENCCEGEVEEDMGRLCAFILTYDPVWTPWKMHLVEELLTEAIKRFDLDEKKLMGEVGKEIDAINKRRKVFINKDLNCL
ncbi:RIO1 family regulatory kinase/ATPase domain-containing protein [Natronincola ferrireducens]|uniref:non-specific serine/threonine protein kinase n=1 Tax=Natronincola ferrireducens TaxID=393762 RepID=A0A1G8ZNV2_9FIRM|nr:RIO1 family regulatory kinase/ATPase [Natronincola ferrireducens]SDK16731.1 RIO1 family protein [Natronincola ferrireducens]